MKMQASSGQIILISAHEKFISSANTFGKSKNSFYKKLTYNDAEHDNFVPQYKNKSNSTNRSSTSIPAETKLTVYRWCQLRGRCQLVARKVIK